MAQFNFTKDLLENLSKLQNLKNGGLNNEKIGALGMDVSRWGCCSSLVTHSILLI